MIVSNILGLPRNTYSDAIRGALKPKASQVGQAALGIKLAMMRNKSELSSPSMSNFANSRETLLQKKDSAFGL